MQKTYGWEEMMKMLSYLHNTYQQYFNRMTYSLTFIQQLHIKLKQPWNSSLCWKYSQEIDNNINTKKAPGKDKVLPEIFWEPSRKIS